MHERANVQGLEALKEAKAALAKFAEDTGAILASVDSDIARMGQWLSHDRPSHWKREVRKREEQVLQARNEISRKQLIQAPEPASTVLERRELQRCQRRVEEARKRQEASRRWATAWDKESMMARGAIMSLAEYVRTDIPRAIAKIDRMMVQLEEYLSIALPASDLPEGVGKAEGAEGSDAGAKASMSRPLAPPPEDEAPTNMFASLRGMAAEALARAKDAREAVGFEAMFLEKLEPGVVEEMSRLALAGEGPRRDQTLVVAVEALRAPAVWLVRGAAKGEADSGWYIAPLEQPWNTGACLRVRVGEVVDARPDLKAVLGLREGALVVLGPTGPMGVLDATDRNVWARGG